MKTLIGIFIILFSFQIFAEIVPQKNLNLPLEKIKLPEHFKISVFAVVPGVRSLTIAPNGTIFAGSSGQSGGIKQVYSIQDSNGDFKADTVRILARDLNMPNGVAYKDGDLYIGEVNQLRVIKNVDKFVEDLKAIPKLETVGPTFPKDRHHGWKFIRFDKNGMLYVPVGAPCNTCDPGTEYARIYKVNLKTNTKEVVADGVRNTVGFDFHPKTNELWFTDNGKDGMGEDSPPDELNRLEKLKSHFGFPYCYGKNTIDPEYKNGCKNTVAAAWEFPAHVAPLGMRFYRGKQFPNKYHDQIFVAEHGSWNRSDPQGYRVSLVKLKGNKPISYKPFAEGWLEGGKSWGRPVDVEIYTDGSLLVSDDDAGVIYRISLDTKDTKSGKSNL